MGEASITKISKTVNRVWGCYIVCCVWGGGKKKNSFWAYYQNLAPSYLWFTDKHWILERWGILHGSGSRQDETTVRTQASNPSSAVIEWCTHSCFLFGGRSGTISIYEDLSLWELVEIIKLQVTELVECVWKNFFLESPMWLGWGY